jgi:CubicO group peptidase (beta-lactamase class C family)
VCDGRVLAERASGVADPATARPWTATTPGQISSISKNAAAALACLLAVRDGLELHAPLSTFLPGAWGDVGLHELLTHTAGVPHWIRDGGALDPSRPLPGEDRIAAVLAAPREHVGAFGYSSPGFLVVGAVLAAATGTAYPDLLRRELLDPLGLGAITVGDPPPPTAATGSRAGVAVPAWDLGQMAGTGDLRANATDLARLIEGIHAPGLLPPAALALMNDTRVEIPVPDVSSRVRRDGYAYGAFRGSIDGRSALIMPGDNPGFLSLACWLPDERIAAAAIVNDEGADIEGLLLSVLV